MPNFQDEKVRGLVVMGGGSCTEGRGFESQHGKLDGYHIFFCKNCNVCLKRRKGWE